MAHAGSCSHLKIFDHKRQPTGTAMRGEKASEGGEGVWGDEGSCMTTRATLQQSRHGALLRFDPSGRMAFWGGVYTHMLGQAAAMLIPFPAAIAA